MNSTIKRVTLSAMMLLIVSQVRGMNSQEPVGYLQQTKDFVGLAWDGIKSAPSFAGKGLMYGYNFVAPYASTGLETAVAHPYYTGTAGTAVLAIPAVYYREAIATNAKKAYEKVANVVKAGKDMVVAHPKKTATAGTVASLAAGAAYYFGLPEMSLKQGVITGGVATVGAAYVYAKDKVNSFVGSTVKTTKNAVTRTVRSNPEVQELLLKLQPDLTFPEKNAVRRMDIVKNTDGLLKLVNAYFKSPTEENLTAIKQHLVLTK